MFILKKYMESNWFSDAGLPPLSWDAEAGGSHECEGNLVCIASSRTGRDKW